MTAFCGLGEWKGTAEVYGGDGRFLGNGTDQRHVRTPLGEDRIRIDLSFVGPFKFSGHYEIHDKGTHRVYAGPANLGLAEAVGENLVDADHYWPGIGLAQRFFLMVLPGGQKQVSLALMSRGERLVYAVVGESDRVVACEAPEAELPGVPGLLDGASIDLVQDAAAGRGVVLLHRRGCYRGALVRTNAMLERVGEDVYEELVEPARSGQGLTVRVAGGGFAPEPATMTLCTDGFAAWSSSGPLAGSYSLFGGRALSGTFQRVRDELRVWRREVISHDGLQKAVIHNWYRGGVRVGVQYGVLAFSDQAVEVARGR
jgi:hypothetical protein